MNQEDFSKLKNLKPEYIQMQKQYYIEPTSNFSYAMIGVVCGISIVVFLGLLRQRGKYFYFQSR